MNRLFEREKNWLLEEKYGGEKCEAFFTDLEKLKANYPLAFLIGFVDFINTKIDLEYKPLIPRPETEFWIYEYIFPKIKKAVGEADRLKILDIFAGSGCIGLSILKNFSNIEVDFGEIKKENILQIKKNIKINNLENKNFQVFQSDIFTKIPKKKYHFILTNPPYIAKEKINTEELQNSVLENEDHLALFAEDDGLYFIKKIILKSLQFLEKNGELWIEFDPWQKEKIINFLKKEKIEKFEFFPDQYKKERFLKISF